MNDGPAASVTGADSVGGGLLRARPAEGVTFAGRHPDTAARQAVCAHSPTRCAVRTRRYHDGVLEAEGFPASEISDHLGREGVTMWLDLHDPDAEDLVVLTEEFGLHPLAMEDAVHEHQRPKLDRYRSHLFLSAYAVALAPGNGQVCTSELAAFITDRALITVRKDDGFDVEALLDRWDDSTEPATGVAFLLHGLLDLLADGHFAVVQALDDAVESLEDELFTEQAGTAGSTAGDFGRRSFAVRKNLVLTRRVVTPMRDVLDTLLRRDLHLVPDAMAPYYQDVRDHVVRTAEWTESLREVAASILDTRVTLQGNRLNEIMKKLTAWAAIIAVPAAVTGYYGQNVPYPGFGHVSGLISSGVLIGVIAAAVYIAFRRHDWL